MTPETTPTAPAPAETPPEGVHQALAAAAQAAGPYGDLPPADRARMLHAVADTLDAHADELVALADAETGLGAPRLPGELTRTTVQLRMFAEAVTEGSWLEAVIDTPDADAKPTPRPDLRRVLVPLGPVLVFAASNFPFAFSVAGGDTASALAVGCPVVVKAHPGHPETSRRTAELVTKALQGEGAPEGVFALVEGMEAGTTALRDPRVRAASFTGSVVGGRALLDVANSRPDPIPFYGELGSLNPVVVTRGAVEARADDVVSGFAGSMTMGTGQFCTKPGLLLLPSGHGQEEALTSALADVGAKPMLNARIHSGHHETRATLAARPGVRTLLQGEDGAGADGVAAAPTLLATDARTLLDDPEGLLTECFGPTALVVEYGSDAELHEVAAALEGSLTATVHGEAHEADDLAGLWRLLQDKAGRLLWNAWPTGVAVTWAQHHGGPWPATTGSLHTSVGMTAGRRFLRPVAYQGTPEALLPPVLRDRNPWDVPRRVNGTLTTADVPETPA